MPLKLAVLSDPALNQQFNDKGYVVVPFYDSVQLLSVLQLLQSTHMERDFGGNQNHSVPVDYHSTFLDTDHEYRKTVFGLVTELFAPFVTQHLNNYKFLQANFFNKEPGKGYVAPHQNLTVVDEQKYTSVSLWCPLQDTDENNGCLFILPGSHRKFARFRNTEIDLGYQHHLDFSKGSRMQAIPVKAGEVLILNDSIIHGSPINHTTKDRFVFHALAAPVEAPIVYCREVDKRMRIYGVDDLFWQWFVPGTDIEPPDLLHDMPYEPEMILKELNEPAVQ